MKASDAEWRCWWFQLCLSINTDSYPHAFKSGEGSEGPQGPQCPQRLDGCEVRITQRVGDQTDEWDLQEWERKEDRVEEGIDGKAEWKEGHRREEEN